MFPHLAHVCQKVDGSLGRIMSRRFLKENNSSNLMKYFNEIVQVLSGKKSSKKQYNRSTLMKYFNEIVQVLVEYRIMLASLLLKNMQV